MTPSSLEILDRDNLSRVMAALVDAAKALMASPSHYLNIGCVDPEAGRRQAEILGQPIKRVIYVDADGSNARAIESSQYLVSGITVEWQWTGPAPTPEEIDRARDGHHHKDDYFATRCSP